MKSEQTKEEILEEFEGAFGDKLPTGMMTDMTSLQFISQALDQYGEAVRKETIEEVKDTAIIALDECYQEWDIERKTSIPTFRKAATRIEEALYKLKGTKKESK